jgi:hypothetical protein
VTVHEGFLGAIYLKHAACGRFPADVGPDETCIGRCQMKWLTTYNPYTLVPTYVADAVVTVPMGVVYADEREAGSWYISVAGGSHRSGENVFANYSIVAELVESPVIDTFIPLDAEKAAAERCGRFCVQLADGSEPGAGTTGLDDGLVPAAAGRGRRAPADVPRVLASAALACLAAMAVGAAARGGRRPLPHRA